MKKTKISIIGILVVTFALLFAIGSIAVYQATNITENTPKSDHGYYIRKGATSSKKLKLADQTQKTLSYKQSSKVSENEYVDIYLHGTDEYSFNQDGNLVSYNAITSALREEKDKELLIPEEDAIKIAKEHIRSFYGNLPEYVFDYCKYYESSKKYLVAYSKQFGSNGFVTADSCFVTITKEGNILNSTAPRPERYDGFDEKLLNGIDFKKMQEFVFEQVCGEKYEAYELEDNIWLKKQEDGGFHLALPVVIQKENDVIISEELTYPLD